VISEIVRPQPDNKVIAWIQSQQEADLYLSVLTFGELEKGIEKIDASIRKKKLRLWVEHDLKQRFANRIIPIDLQVSTQWGVVQGKAEQAGKPMPVIDGLIAVSGLVHDCIVVTRNIADMKQSSAELFNPWA
jgi:predicted nucleic acid-binding protein